MFLETEGALEAMQVSATVGECNVRSLVKINYYQVEINYCQYFFSAEVITLS